MSRSSRGRATTRSASGGAASLRSMIAGAPLDTCGAYARDAATPSTRRCRRGRARTRDRCRSLAAGEPDDPRNDRDDERREGEEHELGREVVLTGLLRLVRGLGRVVADLPGGVGGLARRRDDGLHVRLLRDRWTREASRRKGAAPTDPGCRPPHTSPGGGGSLVGL